MPRKRVTKTTSPSVFIVTSLTNVCGGAGPFQQRVDVTEEVLDDIGVTKEKTVYQENQ